MENTFGITKHFVIFHHDDLDGFTAAAVVYNFIINKYPTGTGIQFQQVSFPTKRSTFINRYTPISKDDTVYIVDYSFTEATKDILFEVANRAKEVIWIDHHVSSLPIVDEVETYPNIKAYVKTDACGALLSWRYLHTKKKAPDVLVYVDDYDRWVLKYRESKFLNSGFYMSIALKDPSSIWWKLLLQGDKNTFDEIVYNGEIVEQYNKINYERQYLKNAYECEFEGYKCVALNYSGNSNAFGDNINNYDICILWQYNGKYYTYGLYTKKAEVNCAEIAVRHGGGGHPGAAGFTSTEMILK